MRCCGCSGQQTAILAPAVSIYVDIMQADSSAGLDWSKTTRITHRHCRVGEGSFSPAHGVPLEKKNALRTGVITFSFAEPTTLSELRSLPLAGKRKLASLHAIANDNCQLNLYLSLRRLNARQIRHWNLIACLLASSNNTDLAHLVILYH